MKKFILISVLAMSALSCFSQSKAIKASYFCEMKIPDEVKDMKDENIRMLVIEQLKEKNLEYISATELMDFPPFLMLFGEIISS